MDPFFLKASILQDAFREPVGFMNSLPAMKLKHEKPLVQISKEQKSEFCGFQPNHAWIFLSDECDFDGSISIGDGIVDGRAPGSDRNPPCKNGGNGEPNDINFNDLTLMELRARCKAKKRKAFNPVKSEISEDESLKCDDVSKNGHVHLKEVNLEEPLINMKLRL
ncbi:hypothetical protein QJS10_CPB17g02200 [Acorus calamus]|uniref:Uncharacterized protein n=1 Tax=Acorus calamus TaxID=4465 RepID=A0AAV9CXR1_ACOCL|nr:hypothetical protein QJS10_CPB17g02200 [Acorus calamus]